MLGSDQSFLGTRNSTPHQSVSTAEGFDDAISRVPFRSCKQGRGRGDPQCDHHVPISGTASCPSERLLEERVGIVIGINVDPTGLVLFFQVALLNANKAFQK